MLKIGTRGSKLALWQATYTQQKLAEIRVESELVIIKTQGDVIQHLSFDKMEGKGFFTKEIEEALLRGEIHMAVHSMKDLPTSPPSGLVTTAVSYRENPADLLIIRREVFDASRVMRVRENSVVGTSAARRKSQMLDFRPDIEIRDLRGNVPTRVEKLRSGEYDAIFLAAAGISRLELDLSDFEVLELDPREFIPAPAQGVLAWQTNRSDTDTRHILQRLHQPQVAMCTNVERRTLQLLDGGCQLPLGVYCERDAIGAYHAYAACYLGGALRRTRCSQSTNIGMAEALVKALNRG